MSDKKLTPGEEDKVVGEALDRFKNGSESDKKDILKAVQLAGQKWLTDEEFESQFQQGLDIAKARGDDEITPQSWLYGTPRDRVKDKDIGPAIMPVILGDWPADDGELKKKISLSIGAKFTENFPDHMLTSVIQISEAWAVHRDDDQPEEDLSIAPSESPNRKEVIFVHALSCDQRQSFYHGEIQRDKDGKFTGLKTDIERHHDPEDPIVAGEDGSMNNKLSLGIFVGAMRNFSKGGNNDTTTE